MYDDETYDLTIFRRRLRNLRRRRKISSQTLSEMCGKSKGMIALYESGRAEPPASVIALLADYFGVTADYLLGRDER